MDNIYNDASNNSCYERIRCHGNKLLPSRCLATIDTDTQTDVMIYKVRR
jgi:hypothetical protein